MIWGAVIRDETENQIRNCEKHYERSVECVKLDKWCEEFEFSREGGGEYKFCQQGRNILTGVLFQNLVHSLDTRLVEQILYRFTYITLWFVDF